MGSAVRVFLSLKGAPSSRLREVVHDDGIGPGLAAVGGAQHGVGATPVRTVRRQPVGHQAHLMEDRAAAAVVVVIVVIVVIADLGRA